MFKHWLLHMGRVQLLTVFLTVVLFLGLMNVGVDSDANLLQQRRTAQITVVLGGKKIAIASALSADVHRVLLRVPAFSQLPDLHNGCEVTSLSMLLNHLHIKVANTTLADEIRKDPTPLQLGPDGQIVRWGNPNYGFVGSVTGTAPGYGVYHQPIAELLDKVDHGQALDLTGSSFARVLSVVATGRPVIVWTTLSFAPVSDWLTWQSPEGTVHATLYEHTVLLVGFDKDQVFVNNPLTGTAAEAVPIQPFKDSWVQLGRQAVTVKRSNA